VAAGPATPPTLVVRIRSIDSVFGDIKHLAKLSGHEEEGKRFHAAIEKVLPKGLAGIDVKKPLGFYGKLEEDLLDSAAVLLLPITDESAFLGLLDSVHVSVKKEEDGAYAATHEQLPLPVYFRFANQYAYITVRDKAGIAANKLLEPGKVLPPNQAETVSVSLRVDQIPNAYKQVIISQAENRIAALDDDKPAGETDAQRAIRTGAAKEVTRHFAALLKEGGELGLRLGTDPDRKEFIAELSMAGQAGSKFEAGIAQLARSKSSFAGLLRSDAAVNILAHASVPPDMQKRLGTAIDELIRTALEKEQDATKRRHAEKLATALAPTLKEGVLDAALTMRGPSENKHYTLLVAIKVKDGQAIDQAIRDLLKEAPKADRAKITLDAETVGDTKIHRIAVPEDSDENFRQNFGNEPFYAAVRNDAIFVALGAGGLEALKGALTGEPQTAPQLLIEASISRLGPAISRSLKAESAKSALKALRASGPDDKARFTIEGGQSLKMRLRLSAEAVRTLSEIERLRKDSGEK
jgi:hypothetical protein